MPTLLQLEWKVGDSRCGLRTNKWLRDQVAERGWQVAELQEPLQEGKPFIIYADLECILEKTETENTSKYQYHRVFSLAYYVHCSTPHHACIGFVAIKIASRGSPRKLEF